MKALLIIDVQNDFCEGGALAVPEGDTIVDGINEIAKTFEIVVTTQDWHPLDHGSFASNNPGTKPYDMGKLGGRDQVMWPNHCVQNTSGAAFHPNIKVNAKNFVKGTNPQADSYSGFFDDDGKTTGLDAFLKSKNVTEVFICGLATDYCVKFTALDALKQGYQTTVFSNLCKAVNINLNDEQNALEELKQKGASIINSK